MAYTCTLYSNGSQIPARGACQSGPRDSAVFVISTLTLILPHVFGPLKLHWDLIRTFEEKV